MADAVEKCIHRIYNQDMVCNKDRVSIADCHGSMQCMTWTALPSQIQKSCPTTNSSKIIVYS